MKLSARLPLSLAAALLAGLGTLRAQPLMENLSRGVVAIHQPDGRVALSWRLLGTDPANGAFNLYRKSDPLPGRGGFGGGRGFAGAAPANPSASTPPRSPAPRSSSMRPPTSPRKPPISCAP